MDSCPVAELPPRRRQSFSVSSTELEILSNKISKSGFRVARRGFKSWAQKMEPLHASTWKKAGIYEAMKASFCTIPRNPSLIISLAENWCPETKSFIFPWGEATITLEDVMVLLGFSVLGSPVLAPLETSEMREAVEVLKTVRKLNMNKEGRVLTGKWISSFKNIGDPRLEHAGFLALWLSHFVFLDAWCGSISKTVLPIAVRLARGEKLAIAPVVLASLYRDLGQICAFARDKSIQKLRLRSLFKLVQVWIWERFRNIRPEALELKEGESRLVTWRLGKQVSVEKESLSFDGFEWRPYCQPLKNWNRPRFYPDEAMWLTVDNSLDDEFVSFARCLRVSQLVGLGFVEDYYPNRVVMQFGFTQDLPGQVTDRSNFTEKEAWEYYDEPLQGLKLYIPSRLAEPSVTTRYQEWWLKAVSEFQSYEEPTETFNASNTVAAADDETDVNGRNGDEGTRGEEGLVHENREKKRHICDDDQVSVNAEKRSKTDEET